MGLAAFLSVFLFLGWLQAAFSFVAPPTNVTIHCHNMHNVLNWSHKRLSPGLRFRVDIGSIQAEDWYSKVIWVNSTAQLQADVSFLSDTKNEYSLVVTAVIGQNESAPEELSFSYFKDSQAVHKCHLDFPSVNVTTHHDDDSVLLRFTHPSLVYLHNLPSSLKKRTRKKKSHELPGFHYDVVIIQQKERHHRFQCKESVCEETITVDAAQQKQCLKMTGELEKISVQATREYCVLPREKTPSYLIPIYVVCSLSALSALGFVLYMVYRKWTTPKWNTLPNSVMFPNSLNQGISEVTQDICVVPEVEPTSPTPLLSTEENEFTQFVLPATEPELRLPIRLSTGEEGVYEEGGINEGPGYLGGRHLEEDEMLYSSGYEKRPVLVKLAPDELTEGYRG